LSVAIGDIVPVDIGDFFQVDGPDVSSLKITSVVYDKSTAAKQFGILWGIYCHQAVQLFLLLPTMPIINWLKK